MKQVGLIILVLFAASTPLASPGSSPEVVELGSRLFSDDRLSADGHVSCATCHQADRAFTDGLKVSKGFRQQAGTRNAPSLLNLAGQDSFFWDGRRKKLQDQVLDPFVNQREHGLASIDDLVARIGARPEYGVRFKAAFGDPNATPARISHALAAFVESLDAGPSRLDRFLDKPDPETLSAAERRGYELFRGAGQCATCHLLQGPRPRLTDDKFHAVTFQSGLPADSLADSARRAMAADEAQLGVLITSDAGVAALGRFNVTRKPSDIGKYRTPSLRNVELTAPYMHDGSVATLEAAIDHEIYYRSIGQGRPVIVTPRERADLRAFLRALTSESLEKPKGRQP